MSWMQDFNRSWETIQEDAQGELVSLSKSEQAARKARLTEGDAASKAVEKGMIRYLFVVVDLSSAMDVKDLKPSRRAATLALLEGFITDYFDQNPISQLGIIVAFKKVAQKVTELSGNPRDQIRRLQGNTLGGGELSLQNALNIAKDSLAQIPAYGSREVLVVMGSLATCDPGDINSTIKELKQLDIRCSVVSLAAEMYVCKQLTKTTAGTYGVALDKEHFKSLLAKHLHPHPTADDAAPGTRSKKRTWIKMGFPQKSSASCPSLCSCHTKFKYDGYFCPQCKTKVCELPTNCVVCALTLVSSPHLARSYHHLLPVPNYTPNDDAQTPNWTDTCFSCMQPLSSSSAIRSHCSKCKHCFCIDCDEFVHNSLFNCPGCLSRQPPQSPTPADS